MSCDDLNERLQDLNHEIERVMDGGGDAYELRQERAQIRYALEQQSSVNQSEQRK
jgi:hypothetical protein